MVEPARLLERLDAIGQSLATCEGSLALIGLGSVGLERERLDAFSDLDFFAIVSPGCKQRFVDRLDWLEAVAPVAFSFRNTADGHKLLFEDGIFCEFAVFEPEELRGVPFAAGRFVWKRLGVDDSFSVPVRKMPPTAHRDVEWLVGEALTNLLVGLGRFQRGEKLSAARFVQQFAVDRLLELAPYVEAPRRVSEDEFTAERRFELRFPVLAEHLPGFIQGYDHTPESAAAILAFISSNFKVNKALESAIKQLLSRVK